MTRYQEQSWENGWQPCRGGPGTSQTRMLRCTMWSHRRTHWTARCGTGRDADGNSVPPGGQRGRTTHHQDFACASHAQEAARDDCAEQGEEPIGSHPGWMPRLGRRTTAREKRADADGFLNAPGTMSGWKDVSGRNPRHPGTYNKNNKSVQDRTSD